jgi:hypothetical protein
VTLVSAVFNALREPGRITKALLPSGAVSLVTALAQSFVPKSVEFSCSGRVSLNYFVGWRCIFLRSCAGIRLRDVVPYERY